MSNNSNIRSEGGLLPADLLSRIRARDPALTGLRPVDYSLAPGETLNEAASRSWARLTGLWRKFAEVLNARAEGDAFEGETLDRWLKPLFQELGFDGLERVRAETIGRDTFAISHRWKAVPVHLVGAGLLIDKRTPGARGAAAANPHGLLQDYLNRKDEYIWGIVSNGLCLRLLRDNRTLTRQAYLEFNLQNIFSAEDQSGYADFFLLWLICHRTRFDVPGGGDKDVTTPAPHSAWIIEVWTQTAQKTGVALQKELRNHAVRALNHLGSGFLKHPANKRTLVARLQSGDLSRDSFKRQLLRVLYRFLFLFVAEDRGLLLSPNTPPAIRARFITYYSTARLRRLSRRYGGTAHGDGWVQLQALFRLLRVDAGCLALGLPPLGGFLFSEGACPDLDAAFLANEHLYPAFRALCVVQHREEHITRVTDFEHFGAEELGSLYESLLELGFKEWSALAGVCEFHSVEGSDRKQTGSFYTPTGLITSLLDTALDPVMDRAVQDARDAATKNAYAPNADATANVSPSPPSEGEEGRGGDSQPSTLNSQLAEALLRLRICDPACGSGHFLVAAAHRLARRIAAIRTGEREPPVDAVRHALREVAARCLYGVDLNPLSVELCKVSIWLEALEPGRPLAFLESHIQCGNSLLGCTPALLRKGLPDEAFKPITGDDPAATRALVKDNRDARDTGQDLLDLASRPTLAGLVSLPEIFAQVEALPDDSPQAVRQKESQWTTAVNAADYVHEMLVHDAWCAAFVLPRRANDITYHFHTGHLRKLEQDPTSLSPSLLDAIEQLAGNAPRLTEAQRERSYRFFHWHLRFPSVFRLSTPNSPLQSSPTGWEGGFDVVLGNPPWEHTELKEKEFFSTRAPSIAKAQTGADRKRLIDQLSTEDPNLYAEFFEVSRHHEGISHFLGNSSRYPLCGRGRINTYGIFAELIASVGASSGRSGFIVPTGIATDDTFKFFFQSLMKSQRLVSIFDFENREGLFPDVDSRVKFCLLTLAGTRDPQKTARFVFFAHRVEHLSEPQRQIELTPEDIERINPNSRTCPVLRTRRDAEITRKIYSRFPVLLLEALAEEKPEVNPWGIRFRQGLFNMTSGSALFVTRSAAEADGWELRGNCFYKNGDRLLPLYEAKLFHQLDHRWATFLDAEESRDLASGEKADPTKLIMSRYWVDERDCLVTASEIAGELRDALWMVWRPESDKDRREGPVRLRRELGRWLAGWRLANEEVAAGAQLLREVIAEANKKCSEKKWREEEDVARELACEYELTCEEAATIARIVDAPFPEQIGALWSLLRVRVPKWFLAFRDITNATNERTSIFTPIPWAGVGHTAPLALFAKEHRPRIFCFAANLTSFALDYSARQKVAGTHLTYNILQQFPVLLPETYSDPTPWNRNVTLAEWLRPYVLELCFTAHDLASFAKDCGHAGAPFRWDDTRRAQLRAELDAAFFILYGLDRHDTLYVLNTFEVLKKNEIRQFGNFQTAVRILSAYDVMSEAARGNTPFISRLDPPPAHPSQEHAITRYPRKSMNARITRVTIRNYRSLAGDAPPVTLGPVTVLVGPNGSGKSSFCDALAFLADAVRNGLPSAINNGDNRLGFAALRRQGSDRIVFRVDAELEGVSGFYELELEGAADGYRVAREAAQWRAGFAIRNGDEGRQWESGKKLEGVSIPSGETALLLPLLRGEGRFNELAETIANVVVYSLPPVELRQSRAKSPAHPMNGHGHDWPSALADVLNSDSKGVLVVALNRITGDIVDSRVRAAGKQQVVEFLHRAAGKPERWASADQESDGTLRSAALLTALIQSPPPSLIAIEEPELAIHPGALTVLRDFILDAQHHAQIVITTHSPELLDHFDADYIRVVHRTGDATRISPMDEDQRQAVSDSLATLGEVLRHEGLRPAEPPTQSKGN